jgi:hypothetical protein
MKTFTVTPRTVYVGDLVHQLNNEIKKSHQGIIKTSVVLEANNYAKKNLPKPDESSVEPYLNSLRGQYKALKKEISVKLKGKLQQFLGTIGIKPLDEKIQAHAQAIAVEADEIQNLEADKGRLEASCSWPDFKKYSWLLFLFGLAECLLTVSCFISIGDIFIIALIVGIIIGLAQVYSAKTTVLFIREIENPRKQKLYAILALVGFSVFSIVIGTLRYYFAHVGIASSVPITALNPFTFAAVNLLLVLASALLVYFFYPFKHELEQLSQIEKIVIEIKKRRGRQQDLIKDYDRHVEKRVEAYKVHGEVAHCEKELNEKIDAFYEEAIGKFKHENVTKRTDGAFPECFKQPHIALPAITDSEFTLSLEN